MACRAASLQPKGGVVVDNRSSLHGLWFLDNPLSSSYSEGAGTGAHRRTPVSAACFTLNFHAGLGCVGIIVNKPILMITPGER